MWGHKRNRWSGSKHSAISFMNHCNWLYYSSKSIVINLI
jgi:hypothetical protein